MIKRFNLPPNQSYSNLLNLVPSTSKIISDPLKGIEKLKNVNNNLNLAVLSTPTRRCILTQKVLPTAYMIKLVASGPTSASTTAKGKGKESQEKGRILTTNGILHPRFEAKLPGKAGWIVCRRDAIELLIKKGSYKSLSPSSSLPSSTTQKIQSQLARRISQEITLFSERTKAESVFLDSDEKTKKRECLIREVGKEEWENFESVSVATGEGEGDGRRLECGISFAENGSESTSCRFINVIDSTRVSSIRKVPLYSLHSFLSSAVLPPTSTNSTANESTPSIPLIEEIKSTIESTLSLYARRFSPNLPIPVKEKRIGRKLDVRKVEEMSDYYLFYSRVDLKSSSEKKDEVKENEKGKDGTEVDLLPLLMSLWRSRLWNGEGWSS